MAFAHITKVYQHQEPWFSDQQNHGLCSRRERRISQPQANRFTLILVMPADSKLFL